MSRVLLIHNIHIIIMYMKKATSNRFRSVAISGLFLDWAVFEWVVARSTTSRSAAVVVVIIIILYSHPLTL